MSNLTVNRCDSCQGIWLDYPELTEIDDTVWNEEDAKGELEFNEKQSYLKCPKCGSQMIKFNYRYSDVVMDSCPNMHGFWLDDGEENGIKEIMQEDKSEYERKIKVEDQWTNTLNHLQSKGFVQKVKSFLNL